MISALIMGTLVGDPVERTASNGSRFWTANLRVPAGEEAVFIGLATFSETAGARLMKLSKGSQAAAVGSLEATSWTDRDGGVRSGWRLTASEILSAYEAAKRRNGGGGEKSEGAAC